MGNKAKWITVTFLLLTTLVYAQRNKVDTLHTYWICLLYTSDAADD